MIEQHELLTGPREAAIPAVYRKFRGCATTDNWLLKCQSAEVTVTVGMKACRGWLWQVWSTRVGVVLYDQDPRDPRVTFWPPQEVHPTRTAKGWRDPRADKKGTMGQTADQRSSSMWGSEREA